MEEDKKKAQERQDREKSEKEKSTSNTPAKTHGKKEWQHIPFVPTVAFNTPLPQARRGGKLQGGARDNGPRGRNNVVDKSTSTNGSPTVNNQLSSEERMKPTIATSSAPSTAQKPKRASSAGPATTKEQRRSAETVIGEGRREPDNAFSRSGPHKPPGQPEIRRQSATSSAEPSNFRIPTNRHSTKDAMIPRKSSNQIVEDDRQTNGQMPATHPYRAMDGEGKSDNLLKTLESTRDTHSSYHGRDRGEGRSDRGRGVYRGRGLANQNSHPSYLANGHGFSGGYSAQYPAGSAPQGRSFSNHERLTSPAQSTGAFFVPSSPHGRSHRSNSRSQSIPHPYGRFSHTNQAGPPHLANLQTDLANAYGYQPEPQGPMSAMSFNPFLPGANLFGMVTVQMEYYFSVDNLCKDTFLRSHMNSQGFVPLSLVAGFRRIQQLTPDLELVRYVCLNSQVIEFLVGEDGVDWIRRRDDWHQWLLNIEERMPAARNDGPVPAAPFQHPQVYAGPPVFDDRSETSPQSAATTAPLENIQFQSLDSAAGQIDPGMARPPPPSSGHHHRTKVPLSAAVSEFSPSVRGSRGRGFSSPDPYSQGINIISDEEMDKLNITFRAKPNDMTTSELPPFHSAFSRTFSNGSIDGTSISHELGKIADRQAGPVNGEVSER